MILLLPVFFILPDMEEVFDKVSGSEYKSVYILSFKAIDEFLYQFPDNAEIVLTYFENNERMNDRINL